MPYAVAPRRRLMVPRERADDVLAQATLAYVTKRRLAQQQGGVQPPASSLDLAQRFRNFSAEVPDFHRVWYAAMDDPDIKRLVLLAPRESAKTSTVLTAAEMALIRDRQTRVGIISKTEGAAVAFIREITRDFESNSTLIDAVGRLKPERPRLWTSNELVIEGADLGKDVSLFGLGVGGQVTGKRCDLLILDDIETLETVITPAARARTREWLAKEALPMLSPGGKAIDVGTRKHDDDVHGWLSKDGSGWTVLDNCTRAILLDGSSYWPEKWSLEELARKKQELDAINIRAWASEYMNTIVPPETQMFDPESWPQWIHLPESVEFYQAWDLAISEKTRSDFTCCVTIAVDVDHNVYVVDVMRDHLTFDATQKAIEKLGYQYDPVSIGIEAVAYQQSAVQEALRRTPLPITPLLTGRGRTASVTAVMAQTSNTRTLGGDKVIRAQLLQARAAAGKVYRPAAPVPWWPDMAQELAFFPDSTHDDQVDALAYALGLVLRGAAAHEWSALMESRLPVCPQCGHEQYDFRFDLTQPLVCEECSAVVVEAQI